MAKIIVPTTNDIFNTDRLLYVQARHKGKKGRYSPWTKNSPITVDTSSVIEAPNLVQPGRLTKYWVDINEIRAPQWTVTEFASSDGSTMAGLEYEIYNSLSKNDNLKITGMMPEPDRNWTTPQWILSQTDTNEIFQWDEAYIHFRYVSSTGAKSNWTDMYRMEFHILSSCTAPEILMEDGVLDFGTNVTYKVNYPTMTDKDGNIISKEVDVPVQPYFVLYSNDGQRMLNYFYPGPDGYYAPNEDKTFIEFRIGQSSMSMLQWSGATAADRPFKAKIKYSIGAYNSAESGWFQFK